MNQAYPDHENPSFVVKPESAQIDEHDIDRPPWVGL
jgi:hypothetical protein